ncbi:helix-turn-helix domain-containing protein [Flavobacterium ginsenosidimutans]|uniref:Helix-turn-helix transcriptional regulator n=1 Tax=Flavobacterium ginsenosidimutans TaxID=687844 RepID=A0ABZ2QFG3_9FLAO|nr:helix-turn-helix transcriptional regulator [Flavobacterium ginsenosidimutans]KAF2332269.1 helix-turn-helix transcriptional regulator [Flavobacterium ginsenosidimutans]
MLHKNLVKARKEKGFSQKQMADMLAMEQTTYSKKERGVSRIRENEWMQFAKILGKDVDELKDDISQDKEKDHTLYLNIIEIISKYNQKLEEENSLLRRQLGK